MKSKISWMRYLEKYFLSWANRAKPKKDKRFHLWNFITSGQLAD